MTPRAVPMFHVPNVAATIDWYVSIGFTVRDSYPGEDDGEGAWASLLFGESEIMLTSGGKASEASRREVDLYLTVADVDASFPAVAAVAEIVEEPHDTFYGMREFIVRDCNGFWVTFGQETGDLAPCVATPETGGES